MLNKNFYLYSITTLFLLFSSLSYGQDSQKALVKSKKTTSLPTKVFNHIDVGEPTIKGSVKEVQGGFDISAGGVDIWGVKDEFNFVYIEHAGDFDLVSRIENLSAPHLYTKAGLMARQDLRAGSKHIYFQIFPNNNPRNKNNGGFEFQYRLENGGEMKAIYPKSFEGTPEFPVTFPNTWIRLQRINNEFTGYCSSDGKNWKKYTTFTMELPLKIFLGIALTSHKSGESASASFRDIGMIKH